MEILITVGLYAMYFIINSLAWVWIGFAAGTGATVAYRFFGGNSTKANKKLKINEPLEECAV